MGNLELMTKKYFHTLDALRFFSFLLVFLQHVPAFGISWYSNINHWGANGVNFFFILSGFLISFLLAQEKLQNNSINLKSFFLRRMLRIWPIYYLLLIIFFILPVGIINKMGLYNQFGYKHEWIYSFTFLENYKAISMNKLTSITPLSMSWSLCVEEQFYLLFPLLVKFGPVKRIPIFLAGIFSISFLVKIAAYFFHHTDFIATELISCLDLFSMGALLGYLVAIKNQRISSIILAVPSFYKWAFIIGIIPLTFIAQNFIIKNTMLYFLYPTIQGVFFTLLLAIFIPQGSKLKISSENILSYFGKISYGLYLFHITIVNIIYLIFLMLGFHVDNFATLFILIILSLTLTIAVSHLSFVFIEKPIFRMKEKYFPK